MNDLIVGDKRCARCRYMMSRHVQVTGTRHPRVMAASGEGTTFYVCPTATFLEAGLPLANDPLSVPV
ncbi:MAG: hypothetical protein IAI48_00570 [Candidatus Eremiobacteraeota bacterium]|nr:hypothetical protein [Candidatus Eremiobacteraeota bacterium]